MRTRMLFPSLGSRPRGFPPLLAAKPVMMEGTGWRLRLYLRPRTPLIGWRTESAMS